MSNPLSLANDSTFPLSVWISLNLHKYKMIKSKFNEKNTKMLQVLFCGGYIHLEISALRLASSAMALISLNVPCSENIFGSAGCSPCSVRCSVAHAASRASLPKSFFVVNAVWKTKRFDQIQDKPVVLECLTYTRSNKVFTFKVKYYFQFAYRIRM